MQLTNGVVEPIAEGGTGSEATIKVELRTIFPGLGGTVLTREGVAAALRIEHNQTSKSGHTMFIRHVVAKKLEDHFYRKGVYVFSHVPRVLGSIGKVGDNVSAAYIYEWAFGIDGFSWIDSATNDRITLHDWKTFIEHFAETGVDLGYDTTDSDDGRKSQNIVHQYPHCMKGGEMCSLWKRIDFGFKSIRIDIECLSAYVRDHKTDLISTLRSDRYDMLRLAVAYLADSNTMTEYDLGRLELLICDYRRSSLMHYAYGFGPTGGGVSLKSGSESLLDRS